MAVSGNLTRLVLCCCVVFIFALAGCSQSSTVDGGPTGWEETHWGMSSDDLQLQLGTLVRPLPFREDFGSKYYSDLVAEPYAICGESFRVFFQMDRRREHLARIFVEVADTTSTYPKRALVADIEALFAERHGSPSDVSTVDEGDLLSISRRWLCDTYAVNLDYLYDGEFESSDLFIAYEPWRGSDR